MATFNYFFRKNQLEENSHFFMQFLFAHRIWNHIFDLVGFVTLLLYVKTMDIRTIYIASPKIICHFYLFVVLGIASELGYAYLMVDMEITRICGS